MGRFDGKVVVIAGASGIVGSGIARGFLAEGAQVIATLRSEKAKDILLDDLRGVDTSKLSNPILDISKEADAQRLARTVKAAHPSGIDHAISSLGAWWQKGVLTEQTLAEFSMVLHNCAGSHFVFASTILPLLKDSPSSSYLFITGSGGEVPVLPVDASLATVAAAAQLGIAMAARQQYQDKAPRVNELRISEYIERHELAVAGKNSMGIPDLKPISHRAVGKLAADIAASQRRSELVRGDEDLLKSIDVSK